MKQIPDLIGKQYNRWHVIGTYQTAQNGDRKWLCRCDCGTTRYVLERNLLGGQSKSCGCLTKENTTKANSCNLQGKSFGELTVLHVSERKYSRRGIWWTCRCSCGELCDVVATLLVTGRKTNCGGKQHKRRGAISNIKGKRFGRLTALYPTEKRTSQGGVYWHCVCDCGTEIDVSYNSLVYGNNKSCGCKKKEHNSILKDFLTYVDGTAIDLLKSTKLPEDNTTGVKGVYFINGKYMAKIGFQRKQYYLGVYNSIEEATNVREEAEITLFKAVVDYYALWHEKAIADPQWAACNPVNIEVHRSKVMGLSVDFTPVIE